MVYCKLYSQFPGREGLPRWEIAAEFVLLMLHLEHGLRADALSSRALGRAGLNLNLGEGRESAVPISEFESWV